MHEKERQAITEQREAEPHPLRRYAELFVSNPYIHARQTPDGSYYKVEQPVTSTLLRRHLRGEITVGLYATSPNGQRVKWVCLDHDEETGLEELAEVAQHLKARGIPSLLEVSRRGGHLWVFFERAPTIAARELFLQMSADKELDVEVYPRTEEGLTLVRGPLGVHKKSNRRYPFLEPDTLQPVSKTLTGNLEYLTQVERVSAAKLAEELARKLRTAQRPAPPELDAAERSAGTGGGYGRENIVQLKEQIGDLRDFIGRFVELNRKGRGSCPFHPPDRNPSFAVHETFWVCFHETNPETGRYLGGDVIDFWMHYREVDFPTALEELRGIWPNLKSVEP